MASRKRFTAIPKAVKEKVYERDGGRCIFCGRPGLPEAHYVSRARGGLGVERNILTLCRPCHDAMDNGKYIKAFRAEAKAYLMKQYEDWNEEELIYRKGFDHD